MSELLQKMPSCVMNKDDSLRPQKPSEIFTGMSQTFLMLMHVNVSGLLVSLVRPQARNDPRFFAVLWYV